ncbi:DNA-(apurinic or apyrimidinic site) lyase [Tepidamorphus gemmatus]|uniref:Formamidopyrimidine-DNA glycosylase n=1 Tax=Tepidamorphus gemmatus TaxID=747076 RepID=A0A4R3MES7_9HYPH|nr:bifunctional DNA-formamidopyrimidine glycosylase/DNA-(apurinic or apyrimidinic site) lyase [Tepidamorphus gemmatus]TCT12006.1 DNA-(apurinic or apyrimidinic site) lyase [Tepidamorphus gemmatus]
MPELPEVETVRRGLAPAMENARLERVVARRPDLRFPLPERFAERLGGRTVTGLGRRAKYLLADLDDGMVLVMHLGMSGSFRVSQPGKAALPGDFHHPRSKIAAHDHVEFVLSGGATVTYNDPRRFGFMLLVPRAGIATHPMFAGLGAEPVGNAFDAAYLAARLAGRTMPLKAALLDQRIVAGLGNIYVCEALHRARLSPLRAAGTLATPAGRPNMRAVRLVEAIRAVIGEAIEAGGSSLRDHVRADGSLGYFQHAFRVYDREGAPCPTPGCRGTVTRIVQSGRSTFLCPRCQR